MLFGFATTRVNNIGAFQTLNFPRGTVAVEYKAGKAP
jgi:hypothetical protein